MDGVFGLKCSSTYFVGKVLNHHARIRPLLVGLYVFHQDYLCFNKLQANQGVHICLIKLLTLLSLHCMRSCNWLDWYFYY